MEMMGLLGGVAGGAFGYLGAMEQADAQDRATQANFAFNVYNAQQKDRWRSEMIAMALKNKREQQLGTTDIRGTYTHFVPGKGWVVEGSPDVLAMIKLQDEEQKRVLGHDLPQQRAHRDRNYQRSLGEEALADTYRRKLAGVRDYGDEGMYGDLMEAQMFALNKADDRSSNTAFTNLFRTGQNSNIDRVASSLAREKNDAYTKAALSAKIAARGSGAKRADEERKNYANLYNLFATRAGQMENISYKPQALDTQGTLSAAQSGSGAAGNAAVSAFGKEGGQLDYIPANMGYGNALAGLGSSIGSLGRMAGAQSRYNNQQQVTGFGGSGYGDDEMYTGGEGSFYSDDA